MERNNHITTTTTTTSQFKQQTKPSSPPLPKSIKEMYSIIEDKISQIYLQRGTLNTTFKLLHLSQSLLISLTYKKNTQFNPYPFHIKFRIEITKTYPCTPPEVLCYTTFCYPSLCDRRDLLYSILTHNWVEVIEKKSKLSEPIEEIVKKIPEFLYKLKENEENYILVYFGMYNINRLYDINDFLVNTKISLYKTFHISSRNNAIIKFRYLLITDIYVLLFDMINDKKRNLGKLVFIGDIRQISFLSKHDYKRKFNNNNNDKELCDVINAYKNYTKQIKIEWRYDKRKVKFVFFLSEMYTRDQLLEMLMLKNAIIKAKFKVFHDDHYKPQNYKDLLTSMKKPTSDKQLETLIQQADYQEQLFQSNKSGNIANELFLIYQRIIEIYSSVSDERYKVYKDKLKELMTDKTFIGLNKVNDDNECKDLFEDGGESDSDDMIDSHNVDVDESVECPFDKEDDEELLWS